LNEESTGQSNYNSLQATLQFKEWHGVTSILNYIWSHSLDNSSDGEDFVPNAAQPNDSNQPHLEYGNSSFDVRQRFTWTFGYQLPKVGRGLSRLKNGWGLDSSLILQAGQPFHFNYNFEDDFSGSGSGFDRPDVIGPIIYHPSDPLNFVGLSSFAVPCSVRSDVTAATGSASACKVGTRHYGNQRRNSLKGPKHKQLNVVVSKNTQLNERVNLQLRGEIYNIFNHPRWVSP
jgi:hypothetical protein